MNAFLAIIGDTWRQSKQQVVFFVLAGVLLLTSLFFISFFRVKTVETGEILSFPYVEDRADKGLELVWDLEYLQLVHKELGHDEELKADQEEVDEAKLRFQVAAREMAQEGNGASPEKQLELQEKVTSLNKEYTKKRDALEDKQKEQIEKAQKLVDERTQGMSDLDKGVEIWLGWASSWLFRFSMWLFIAACGVYFPNMLGQGAVDVLISKPVTRAQLFFGKFAGGLVLFSALLLTVYVLTFLGVGIRTGVWHLRFFAAMPLTIFSAALLFAIVGWIGVFTRSTAFSIIIGYFFYVVVDTFLGWVFGVMSRIPPEWGGAASVLKKVGDGANYIFPGFGRLMDASYASTLNVPILDAQPVVVALVWLGVCLGTAYWRFQRLDF